MSQSRLRRLKKIFLGGLRTLFPGLAPAQAEATSAAHVTMGESCPSDEEFGRFAESSCDGRGAERGASLPDSANSRAEEASSIERSLRERRIELERGLEEMTRQQFSIHATTERARADLAAAEARLSEVAPLTQRHAELETLVTGLKRQVGLVESTLKIRRQELAIVEGRLRQLRHGCQATAREYVKLRRDLAATQTQFEVSREEEVAQFNRVESLRNENDQLALQRRELEETLGVLKLEAEAYEARLNAAHDGAHEAEAWLTARWREVRALEDRLVELEQHVARREGASPSGPSSTRPRKAAKRGENGVAHADQIVVRNGDVDHAPGQNGSAGQRRAGAPATKGLGAVPPIARRRVVAATENAARRESKKSPTLPPARRKKNR